VICTSLFSFSFFSFLGCCECGKKLYQQKAHMMKIKIVPKIYLANAFFYKKPLGDYIKGHRVHGGNEAYFFGYILWLLKPQIHQYLAICTRCWHKILAINLSSEVLSSHKHLRRGA